MIVNVDSYEQLVAVVMRVYYVNTWTPEQTRIIIHNLGDVSYAQLALRRVGLKFPILINIESTGIRLFHMEDFPEYLPDLSYDDWDDLFN